MARGISISLVSDVRDFLTGTKKAGKGLDEVADALENVGEVGDQEGERLESSFKEAFDAASRASRDSANDVAANTKGGMAKATDTVGEFKKKATEKFSEVAATFKGDIAGAIQLVQGTLGGMAARLPAIGVAFALLGAAGGAFYQAWKTAAEDTEKRIDTMYTAMLESGRLYLEKKTIAENLQKIYGKEDGAPVSIGDLRGQARKTNIPESLLARAYAGDPAAIQQVQGALGGLKSNLYEDWQAAKSKSPEEGLAKYRVQGEQRAIIDEITDALKKQSGELEEATDRAQGYRDALKELNNPGFIGSFTIPVQVDTSNIVEDVQKALDRARFETRVAAQVYTTNGRRIV